MDQTADAFLLIAASVIVLTHFAGLRYGGSVRRAD